MRQAITARAHPTSAGYRLGPRVRAAAATQPYRRRRGDPAHRPLRIYAVDPELPESDGGVATLNVPWEPLDPGPSGALLVVDGFDRVSGARYLPADLEAPEAGAPGGRAPSVDDPRFHQQMAYAVASHVYAAFTRALGRTPSFAVRAGHAGRARLRIVPFGARGVTGWYDRARGEIVLGYARRKDGHAFAALSHDIVAHEMCHALVDGLRARFDVPMNPDVPALHEALADLVALFSRFGCAALVERAFRRTGSDLRRAAALAAIARQAAGSRHRALRSALGRRGAPRVYDAALPPHRLGAVLVGAVYDAFVEVFERKTAQYVQLAGGGRAPVPGTLAAILARECGALARQFQALCIRAIDYCPPADVELGEFLRAVVTADRDLVPDDAWGYRRAWIDAFRRRGIHPPGVAIEAGEEAIAWAPPDTPLPRAETLRVAALRFGGDPAQPAGPDELERQAHAVGALVTGPGGAWRFGLEAPGRRGNTIAGLPVVESVRALRREAPDGRTRLDLVAEVTQEIAVDEGRGRVVLVGGSTIVIGPDGEVRCVIRKGTWNAERRASRLAYVRSRTGV
ncbi:MAG TPA: hypothetical protein VF198_18860 [Vicinamibacterales bacterium]